MRLSLASMLCTRPWVPGFDGRQVSAQGAAGEPKRTAESTGGAAYCVGLEGLLELRSPNPTDQRDPAAAQKDRAEVPTRT
jgi:hypothetical protein